MARVFVHLPLNNSRALEEMLKEFGKGMEKKYGIQVEIDSQLQCRPDNVSLENIQPQKEIDQAGIPDLPIGHVNYFSQFPKNFLEEHFRPLPGRFPIRPELAKAGFADPKGYFHPFVVGGT